MEILLTKKRKDGTNKMLYIQKSTKYSHFYLNFIEREIEREILHAYLNPYVMWKEENRNT